MTIKPYLEQLCTKGQSAMKILSNPVVAGGLGRMTIDFGLGLFDE